jgi:hypothetical protein
MSLQYHSHELQDGIGISYKYDVLTERGNRKYAKKEKKYGVKLVAVKVTNHTDTPLTIGKDIAFYSGQYRIFLMEPTVIRNTLKQNASSYLFYLLLTFLNFSVTNDVFTQTYPVGLVLGPTVTLGNASLASSANKDLHYELNQHNMMNVKIGQGETVYGIIGVRDIGYYPISLRVMQENLPGTVQQ